jgi:hypothetical protein
MSNPIKLTNALQAITSNLTVDQDFSNKEIRSLALSLRGMSTEDVTFVTIPTVCCPNIDGQSTVKVKMAKTKELFQAVSEDSIDTYLAEHKADLLGDAKSVS